MIRKIGANEYGVEEYACSHEDEVKLLPHLLSTGSTCVVVTTGNVYMFNEENSSWHSLVDNSIVVKPDGAYNKPTITSLTMTPIDLAWGEVVTFNYEATYDNSSMVEEKWYNKRNSYPVGKNKVGIQVKDQKGKWSDIVSLTFIVSKKTVNKEESESLTKTANQTYIIPQGWTLSSVSGVGTHQNGQVVFNAIGQCVVKITKPYEEENQKGIITKTVTITINKQQIAKEEKQTATVKANQKYAIPVGYNFVSVDGVGSRVLETNEIVFSGTGTSTVKAKKVEEGNLATTITTLTVTITVEEAVTFDGYLKITSEDWGTTYAEGSKPGLFNLETTSKVKIGFYGNSSTEGFYKKQYSNIQLNGQPLDLTNIVPTVDGGKIESHSYLDSVLKITTKYTGTWGAVYYVVDLEQGENTITFDCADWE